MKKNNMIQSWKVALPLSLCISCFASSAISQNLYEQDKTSISWGGYIRSTFFTYDNDISHAHIPGGTGAKGLEHASKGDVYNQNYTNLWFQGKSYFAEHTYGIGYFYTRVWGNSKLGVTPRSLYAGIGDDRYGQFLYGFMYGALNKGHFASIGLNYEDRATTSVVPQPFQKRQRNTIGYNYLNNNFSLYSTFALSDGNFNVNEDSQGWNDSGYKSPSQFFLSYALGDSGVKLGAGAGITQVKTLEANFGKAWMAELDMSYSSSNWYLAQTLSYGKSITSGISGVDKTGQFVFGRSDFKSAPVFGNSLAKFYSTVTAVQYITGGHHIGLEYDFSRFFDFDNPENLVQNRKPLGFGKNSQQTSINQLLLTYNYLFNRHFSTGVEYIKDLIPSSSSYHQGNGVWGQIQYSF